MELRQRLSRSDSDTPGATEAYIPSLLFGGGSGGFGITSPGLERGNLTAASTPFRMQSSPLSGGGITHPMSYSGYAKRSSVGVINASTPLFTGGRSTHDQPHTPSNSLTLMSSSPAPVHKTPGGSSLHEAAPTPYRRGLPPVNSLMESPYPSFAASKPNQLINDFTLDASHRDRADERRAQEALTLANVTHTEEEIVWSQWVVVFGYSPSLAGSETRHGQNAVSRLYDLLSSYGTIAEYADGPGNWTFFKFSSSIEASRCARSLNGSFLATECMLGVLQLSPILASQSNLRLTPAGQLDSSQFGGDPSVDGSSSVMNRNQDGFGSRRYGQVGRPMRDVFHPPSKQGKGICAKIVEFFFFS